MFQVDLNSDIGESFGAYTIGQDEQVLNYITSANIACGFHAGDPNVMDNTIKMAVAKGVGLGVHPGLPDLIGFGRRPMQISPKEVYNLVVYQIGALQAFAATHGASINHVKPHGALFNMAGKDRALADAIAEAVYNVDKNLILFGLAGSELVKAGKEKGLFVAQEVFADRTYQPDGSLTSRVDPNAMIHDADIAVAQVIRMVTEGKVRAVDGNDVSIQADTVCVHGDEPGALQFVKKLTEEFSKLGIEIKKVGSRSE